MARVIRDHYDDEITDAFNEREEEREALDAEVQRRDEVLAHYEAVYGVQPVSFAVAEDAFLFSTPEIAMEDWLLCY